MRRIGLALLMSLSLPFTAIAAPVKEAKDIVSSIQSATRSKQLQANVSHLQQRMTKATAKEKQQLGLVMDELYNDYYYTDALPAQQRRKWNFIRSNEDYVRMYKKVLQWPNKQNGYYLAPRQVKAAFFFKERTAVQLPENGEYEQVMKEFDQQFFTKNSPTFTAIERFYHQHYEQLVALRQASNQVLNERDVNDYYIAQLAEREKALKAYSEAEIQAKWQQLQQTKWVDVKELNDAIYQVTKSNAPLTKRVAECAMLVELNDWYKEWLIPERVALKEIEQLQVETMYLRPAYIEVKAKLSLLKRSAGSVGDFYEHYRHLSNASFLALYGKWKALVQQDKWIKQSIEQVEQRLTYYDKVILGYKRADIAAPLQTMDIDTILNDISVYENAYETRMKQWLREFDNELNKK